MEQNTNNQQHQHNNSHNNQNLKQRYKSYKSIFSMVVVYSLGMLYLGYCLVYIGAFKLEQIVQIFSIQMDKNIALGLLQGCLTIGGITGAFLTYPLLRYVSRRKIFLIVNFAGILINLIIFIPNLGVLFFCRVFQGICAGSFTTIVPVMIKQIVPYQISGSFGAFNQLFTRIGAVIGFILQYLIIVGIQNHGGNILHLWRIQFGFPIVILALQASLLIFVYDFQTPKYLLSQGREQQCRDLISRIYKQEFIQQVMTQKKIDLGLLSKRNSKYNPTLNPQTKNTNNNNLDIIMLYQIDLQVNNNSNSQKVQQKMHKQKNHTKSNNYLEQTHNDDQQNPKTVHRKKVHRKALRRFVTLDLSAMHPLSGTNAITSYGVLIILQIFHQYANVIPIFINLVTTFLVIIASYLLTKFGRKTVLQVGTMIISLSLFTISIGYFIDADKFAVMIVIGIFCWTLGIASFGPIVLLYIPEIIQPQFSPFPMSINWLMSGTVLILFPILVQSFGSAGPIFLFFAVYTLVFFVINQECVVQTKGKTEKQIYDQYDLLF